jgi:hypothetical protein
MQAHGAGQTLSQNSDICFVFGALRSGTTLFRLMLDHHPQLVNPGEVDFLFDHIHEDAAHPTGWRYDLDALQLSRIFRARGLEIPAGLQGTDLLQAFLAQFGDGTGDKTGDKTGAHVTLNVHRNASKIARLLPQARVIHMLRDGRDVASSSIGMGWVGNSYYGVDHWIATERDWDAAAALLPEAQRMELRFEALMSDLEGQLAAVCAFMGVDFAPEMLRYHETSSYGPPDPKIAQQWKRKAPPRMIALIEGKCAALLQARGYDLAGPGPAQPNAWERLWLPAQNRVKRSYFNFHRLGPGLFLRFHFARLLGTQGMKTRLRFEKQQKIQSLLK